VLRLMRQDFHYLSRCRIHGPLLAFDPNVPEKIDARAPLLTYSATLRPLRRDSAPRHPVATPVISRPEGD